MKDIVIYGEVKQCTEEEFETISKFFNIVEKPTLVVSDSLDIDDDVYVLHLDHEFKDAMQCREFYEKVMSIGGFHKSNEEWYRTPKSDESALAEKCLAYGKYSDDFIYSIKSNNKNHTKDMKKYNRRLVEVIKDMGLGYYTEVRKPVSTVIVQTPSNKNK